jgi:hypothetical protein
MTTKRDIDKDNRIKKKLAKKNNLKRPFDINGPAA